MSTDAIINMKYFGKEPTLTKEQFNTVDYVKTLSWYSYIKTKKDAKDYLQEYLEKYDIEYLKKLRNINENCLPLTAAWVSRILIKNDIDDDGKKKFILSKIDESYAWKKIEDDNVSELPRERRKKSFDHSTFIGDIEAEIDKNNYNFSLYNVLKEKVIPFDVAVKVKDYYKPILDEMNQNIVKRSEGYEKYSKNQLRNKAIFYGNIIKDCDTYLNNKTKTRNVRKIKQSIRKKLAKFVYKKEDNDLQIVSIAPQKIIGAKELWTYNSRYKILTVLKSKDGLDVRGMTIINIDETNSFSKKIGRKTKEIVDTVVNKGKIELRTVMQKINTSEVKLATRLNDETILLRVF